MHDRGERLAVAAAGRTARVADRDRSVERERVGQASAALRLRCAAPSASCSGACADTRCRRAPCASDRRRRRSRRDPCRRRPADSARTRRARPDRRRAARTSSRSRRPVAIRWSPRRRRSKPRALRRCRRRSTARGTPWRTSREPGAVGHRGGDADDASVRLRQRDQRVGKDVGERRSAALVFSLPFSASNDVAPTP